MSLFLCTCKTKKLENLWDILNAIVVYLHFLYIANNHDLFIRTWRRSF